MLYLHHPHIDRIALEEATKKSKQLILCVTNTGENVWWTLFSWGVEVSLRLRAQNFEEKISCMIRSLGSCGYSTVCSVLMCFTFENWMNDCIKRQQNKTKMAKQDSKENTTSICAYVGTMPGTNVTMCSSQDDNLSEIGPICMVRWGSVTANIGWYIVLILHDWSSCSFDITWP